MKHPVTLRVNGVDYPVEVEGHQSLLSAVRELHIPHASSNPQPYVTVSVGVVAVDAYRMATHDAAVAMADEALYAAKNKGRDQYVSACPEMQRLDPTATAVLPMNARPGLNTANRPSTLAFTSR